MIPSRIVITSSLFALALCLLLPGTSLAVNSVARQWDEEILDGIRIDLPRPPVHGRNLFHLSAAMYDAWAAYDPTATGYFYTNKETAPADIEDAREEAISFAAFGVLTNRYALSVNAGTTFTALVARMASLGYDTNLTSDVGSEPWAVGNRIAAAIINFGMTDGANQANNYTNTIGYQPVNEPLVLDLPGTEMVDPNRWQPLAFDYAVTQNGIEAELIQTFVGPHWGKVTPFCLLRQNTNDVYLDRGPQPILGGATDAQLKHDVLRVIEFSSKIDPDDNVFFDYSPAYHGNNTLGYNDGAGYPSNPVTGLPYATNLINQADFGRVIAEFWADGPASETPPGHWNVLANYVSDQTSTVKRVGGTGPVVNDLEWDVKMYFGINAAVHDAAVCAWNHKGIYDSVRPISLIRYMGGLGQSTEPSGPSYHPWGLPLVSGVVEVVTSTSVQPGQRHYALATNLVANYVEYTNDTDTVGTIAIHTWPGEPDDPTNQYSGVRWIRAIDWKTYQKVTFVTPPFAGYISGHSTFSRAGAEYLTLFTGSPYFPGGLGEYVVTQGTGLAFEYGPSEEVHLQWATYFDASDEAGISRLWGGIHIDSDDHQGRILGSEIGKDCYELATQYYDGHPLPHPPFGLTISQGADPDTVVVSWPCVTGRSYQVECSTDGFTYTGTVALTAGEVGVTVTNPASPGLSLYRVSTVIE